MQIPVVVAYIQMGTLKTEVEKGSCEQQLNMGESILRDRVTPLHCAMSRVPNSARDLVFLFVCFSTRGRNLSIVSFFKKGFFLFSCFLLFDCVLTLLGPFECICGIFFCFLFFFFLFFFAW